MSMDEVFAPALRSGWQYGFGFRSRVARGDHEKYFVFWAKCRMWNRKITTDSDSRVESE